MNSTPHNGTNGHANDDGEIVQETNALRVYRVNPGDVVHLRTLSDGYGGLFTHFFKNRSYYCSGPDCNSMYHKMPRIWKGYSAVEIYSVEKKKWRPFVLEISEHLELDFRGIYKRGQVWELYRTLQTGKKATPVQGKLHEERGPSSVPAAFDIRPVLLHLYHCMAVSLDAKNPMPPRTFLADSDGDAPKVLAEASKGYEPMSLEEHERRMKEWNERKKTPTETKPPGRR